MSFMRAILIFMGLSMDSFVVMMDKGATLGNLTPGRKAVYALIFALVNAASVAAGYGTSGFLAGLIPQRAEVFTACLIILFIGNFILYKSFRISKVEEHLDRGFDARKCLNLAFATSLDTLFLALGFAFIGIRLLDALILSFLMSFGVVYCALSIGYSQGASHNREVGMSGGALMIVFSLIILARYVLIWS